MADKTSPCCWSQLPTDILESILKRLSFIDVIRFEAVCSSWYSASSSSYYSTTAAFHQTPCLMFPPSTHQQKVINTTHDSFRFFNLEENRAYEIKNMPKEKIGDQCLRFVGSSHGWLIHQDFKKVSLNLLNLFSRARIQLPSLKKVRGVSGDCFLDYMLRMMTVMQEHLIAKAILSSDPGDNNNNNNCRAIVIYCQNTELAFCNCGDSTWTNLNGKHQFYSDIIFYNDHLYALDRMGSVEVWNFRESNYPTKTMDINGLSSQYFLRGIVYANSSYLVESLGDILLVVRFPEKSDFYFSYEKFFRYKTKMFDVYKMDFDQEKWVEVESVGDRVLFVGRNHSLSLSARDVPAGCKENSIYFTEDYLYGGHDMGVFNLEDKSIEPFYQCESCDSWKNIECSPFWVFPNPW